nr:hypothetical protein CFP56_21713 [Quercus suber]
MKKNSLEKRHQRYGLQQQTLCGCEIRKRRHAQETQDVGGMWISKPIIHSRLGHQRLYNLKDADWCLLLSFRRWARSSSDADSAAA